MLYRICLDLDGVFSNFVLGVCHLFHRDPDEVFAGWTPGCYDVCETLKIKDAELWERVAYAPRQFWVGLKPYDHGTLFLQEVENICQALSKSGKHKVEWVFCSSPSTSNGGECLEGKWRWVQNFTANAGVNPPYGFRNFIFTSRKCFCAAPNAVLIDDHEGNVKAFKTNGGEGILFPTWWNPSFRLANSGVEHTIFQYAVARRELLRWAHSKGLEVTPEMAIWTAAGRAGQAETMNREGPLG